VQRARLVLQDLLELLAPLESAFREHKEAWGRPVQPDLQGRMDHLDLSVSQGLLDLKECRAIQVNRVSQVCLVLRGPTVK